jgi:hypothetical protein
MIGRGVTEEGREGEDDTQEQGGGVRAVYRWCVYSDQRLSDGRGSMQWVNLDLVVQD